MEDWGCAGWAWAQLAEVCATQGRAHDAIDAASQALALTGSGPRVERLAWICLALGEGLLHGAPAGLDRIRQRLPQPPEQVPDPKPTCWSPGAPSVCTRALRPALSATTGLCSAPLNELPSIRSPDAISSWPCCWSTAGTGTRRWFTPAPRHRSPLTTSRCGSKPNARQCWPRFWLTGATGSRRPPHQDRRNALGPPRQHRSRHHRKGRLGRYGPGPRPNPSRSSMSWAIYPQWCP